jgi:hypothetical protein
VSRDVRRRDIGRHRPDDTTIRLIERGPTDLPKLPREVPASVPGGVAVPLDARPVIRNLRSHPTGRAPGSGGPAGRARLLMTDLSLRWLVTVTIFVAGVELCSTGWYPARRTAPRGVEERGHGRRGHDGRRRRLEPNGDLRLA